MSKLSNREDKIVFDRNAYVKISDEYFEYYYGVVTNYNFKIPIKNILEIYTIDNTNSNSKGCNFLLGLVSILASGPDSLDSSNSAIKLIVEYELSETKKWKKKVISWPGLTEEKANQIINILKLRNRKL